jgi:hypothetical protein
MEKRKEGLAELQGRRAGVHVDFEVVATYGRVLPCIADDGLESVMTDRNSPIKVDSTKWTRRICSTVRNHLCRASVESG